ncbi:hypothetical protein [Evansella tamaricis]|uniref:Uncharacterized protein n=1 Tax=Evansella tamaricis TaxID=2069301 RepID=A0ABS6JML4_9BACI|nr:hypothetical protein [Evansella tamaricis]MBU9714914.1 hypothetical protein [Evansella tamaricis]
MPERAGGGGFRSEAGASCARTERPRWDSVRSWSKLFPNGEAEKDFGQKLEQVVPERGGREGFRSEVGATCSRTRRPRSVSVRSWSKLFPNERVEKGFG